MIHEEWDDPFRNESLKVPGNTVFPMLIPAVTGLKCGIHLAFGAGCLDAEVHPSLQDNYDWNN